MKQEKKTRSIKTSIRIFKISLWSLIGVLTLTTLVCGIIMAVNYSRTTFLIYWIIAMVCIIAITFESVFSNRKMTDLVYRRLYETTLKNYDKINQQEGDFIKYKGPRLTNLTELTELNDLLDEIEKHSKTSIIYNGSFNLDGINLEFISKNSKIATYKSLLKNYRYIIEKNQGFRTAFISFQYSGINEPLNNKEISWFERKIKSVFDYDESVLVAFNIDADELIVVLKNFDSYDRLKEDLSTIIQNVTIVRPCEDGSRLLSARASVVVYPNSKIENIFNDLKFASRSGETINIYIPETTSTKNEHLLQLNMNSAAISLMIENFSSIDLSASKPDVSIKESHRILKFITDYYKCDYIGVSFYDSDKEQFYTFDYYQSDYVKATVDMNNLIERSFVDVLEKHIDVDNTYYFSKRSHCTNDIGRRLDIYGINSGYFFVIKGSKGIDGVIYILRKEPAILDTYLREGLLIFCNYYANFFKTYSNRIDLDELNKRLNDVLKLSGCGLYTIDKESYKITRYSETLRTVFPKVSTGLPCYKCLHDFDAPCKNCILKTGKKMPLISNGVQYEVCTSVFEPRKKEATLFISPSDKDFRVIRDKYDVDLLTDSFYSFIRKVRDSFDIAQRGQILILNVDNTFEVLDNPECVDYTAILRIFVNEIKNLSSYVENVYSFNNSSFAILLNDLDRNETVALVENIYNLTQKTFFDKRGKETINITYFVLSYPAGYQNADDYIRNLLTKTVTPNSQINKNMLFFPETKYQRFASHKDYVTDILNNFINKNTFNVLFQPEVNCSTNEISSTEMLLRVSDMVLGNEMKTYEIIQSASENNRISMITDLLIEYIGSSYAQIVEKMNAKAAKSLRFSLNTDYSFFADSTFVSKVNKMQAKYHLPNNLITFEIRESEINTYYEKFEGLLADIRKSGIRIVCDNYTGQYLSIQRLSKLGFSGIKIDRSLTSKIGLDKGMLGSIKMMIEEAEASNIKATVVGVETKEQYNLLKQIQNRFDLQGFYLYRPIPLEQVISALFKANN